MRLSDTCVAAGQLTSSVSDGMFAVAVFAVAALSSLFQVSPPSISGFTTEQLFSFFQESLSGGLYCLGG